MKTVILNIPTYRMENFDKMVAKLNKIAIKTNSPTVSVKKLDINVQQIKVKNNKIDIEFQNVELTFDRNIEYSGYEFQAKLDHEINGITIIHLLEGKHIPKQYYNATANCECCNKIRPRNNTYILKCVNDDTYIQVGSSCLAQFLGINPEKWLELYSSLINLENEEEYELDYISGRIPRTYNIDLILKVGLYNIKRHGYVSKKMSEENSDLTATSELVQSYIFDKSFNDWYIENEIELSEYSDKVESILKYCSTLDTKESEYIHNIVMLAQYGYCKHNQFGYVVSMIPMYEREIYKNQKLEQKFNEYYGKEKDKIELELKVLNILSFPNYPYGYVYMHIMEDMQGRSFIWNASNQTDMQMGNVYKIKGTIKGYKEYKETKQTILTRCKVVLN